MPLGGPKGQFEIHGGTAILALAATVMVFVAGSLILGLPWVVGPIVFLFFFYSFSVTRRADR
ncbi:MAG TPA: hypothetical protein VD948_08640 [Rhodothermales bacterium]|nr:hypothetical protein [Rhodothermales bacterium]